jgi:hypothetical protein
LDETGLYNVLEFIYKGDTTISAENCLDILVAANGFVLPELRTLAEVTIAKNLDTDNVADVLRYAELYQANYLHNVSVVFTDFYK